MAPFYVISGLMEERGIGLQQHKGDSIMIFHFWVIFMVWVLPRGVALLIFDTICWRKVTIDTVLLHLSSTPSFPLQRKQEAIITYIYIYILMQTTALITAALSLLLMYTLCPNAVWGHYNSEPQEQGHVPPQILPLQLFFQGCSPQGQCVHPLFSLCATALCRVLSVSVSCHQVTGVVTDGEGSAHYILSGTWDDKMESAKIIESSHGWGGSEGKQKTVYQTRPPQLLWKKYSLP